MLEKGKDQRGKAWTSGDEKKLDQFAKKNTPTRLIAYALGRTEDAIRSKASELGVPLTPTNQAPYNRRKK